MKNNNGRKKMTITGMMGTFRENGFRDMLLMLFGLTETLLLRAALRIPRPLKIIAAMVLLSGYVNLLLTGPAATILTVILTTFVKKRIKGWNVELKIMKYMTQLRAQ